LSSPRPATFGDTELAVVLSHYDLGVIESIRPFGKGSRKSPKVAVVCERGKFLLKRRAPARADQDRVRIAHAVQRHLLGAGYPAARLIPTRGDGRTIVQLRNDVYELFEFTPGRLFDQSAVEARDAGVMLAGLHAATAELGPQWSGPRGSYHDLPGVRSGLCAMGSKLKSHDSFTGDEAELASLVQFLLETYDNAAEAVNALGLSSWPDRVSHCDWHPGNLLFRKHRVVAVIDFDSVRLAKRILDVANGALQFSMMAGEDPDHWPSGLDEARFTAFLDGYSSASPVSKEEVLATPHLMAEALIAECVPPISETGLVGRWSGYRVLRMVRRKLEWLTTHREGLIGCVTRS
jgi:Ser/Thr protein kinase RdoA (MazF antagonist)